jgi:hypothetical protein
MMPGSSFTEQCTEWHSDGNLQPSLLSSLFNDLKVVRLCTSLQYILLFGCPGLRVFVRPLSASRYISVTWWTLQLEEVATCGNDEFTGCVGFL